MGENNNDLLGSNEPEILPTQYDQFPRHELYKIWLAQNGYPREISNSHWNEYRNLPEYRRAVAIDLSIYLSFVLVWVLISSGLSYAPVVVGAIVFAFMCALLLEYVLPRDVPVTAVGLLSVLAHFRGVADLKLTVQPPPITSVHLDTFPIVLEAARRYAKPALSEISTSVQKLSLHLIREQTDKHELENLRSQLLSEAERSDEKWQKILNPKISKIEELLGHTDSQILELQRLIENLELRQQQIKQQIEQLEHRYDLIKRVEQIEKTSATDETLSISSVDELMRLLQESQLALSEAALTSTAHEQAKTEIAELLDR